MAAIATTGTKLGNVDPEFFITIEDAMTAIPTKITANVIISIGCNNFKKINLLQNVVS